MPLNSQITDIGASLTTMEDVFIKVGEIDEVAANAFIEPPEEATPIALGERSAT